VAASSATNEALLRELLAGHANVAAEVKGLSKRVDGVDQAARETRDAARDSAAATKAQDIPASLEKLRGQVEKSASDSRADLVNSISRVTGEMREGPDSLCRDAGILEHLSEAIGREPAQMRAVHDAVRRVGEATAD
jgi:hypothetical protein